MHAAMTVHYFTAGVRVGFLKLFAGASELPSLLSKGFERTYVKPGSKENAIKEFYATQPTDIQTYDFPLGVSLYNSRAAP